jgi:hypothetical protein
MSRRIVCPGCESLLAVDERTSGVVACPRCGGRMRVDAIEPDVVRQETAVAPVRRPGMGPSAGRRAERDDDLGDEPPPVRSRRTYDSDEDEWRPRRKRSRRGPAPALWIGGGVALLLVVGVVVLVVLLTSSGPGGGQGAARQNEPGRHLERAGNFSYVPPVGWRVSDFPGLKYKVVTGTPVNGFAPNLNFIEENANLPLADYVDASITSMRAMLGDFRLIAKEAFTTREGLRGYKVVHENRQMNQLLRQCQYMFENGRQKIVITGTAPATGANELAAVFDECARSFRFE